MLIKMKKKILFVIPEYSIGGTNTSLKNLLSFIDMDRYDVFIYCLYEDGGYYFKNVFKPYILQKSRLYYWLHDNIITRKFMGLGMKLSSKINFDWLYKRETKWLQMKYDFDVVIGFQEGITTIFASYFQVNKKIAWFHSPYINFVKDIRSQYLKYYKSMDAVICVSNVFVKDFINVMPELRGKVHCLYNTLNNESICMMSKEPINDERFDNTSFSLVSIGRFTKQKQFALIPQIVDGIKKEGVNKIFKWYIIASGDACRKETECEIERYGVKDHVIILGEKPNPYPVLNASNLYVCTSDSESFSYTIAESKILHTPLVSNGFPVAYEVVDDTVGWICNINDMANKIADIINDKDGMYSKVKDSIAHYRYNNEEIMSKFYKLID